MHPVMGQAPLPLDFPSGVTRDATLLDSQTCVDALWCRWRRARPRKILGYKRITDELAGIGRCLHIFYSGVNAIIHIGTTQGMQQVVIDYFGNFVSIADRTPAGYVGGNAMDWTIDAIFDTQTGEVNLVAHSVPDAGLPTALTQTVPYIGPITGTGPLVQFNLPAGFPLNGGSYTQPLLAGGVVSVQPFLFGFDQSGLVMWSPPNIPLGLGITGGTSGAGQARISAQKIMAGMPLRGGGAAAPAVIFWSVSEVITGTFVGSSAGEFAFSTISPSSSILSTGAVAESDGLYFWAGVDAFYVYNGTVQEIPNPYNADWFFENLNRAEVGKVQALRITRYGEIWWLAPMFGATENSHAIIYNYRENVWYDTLLPNGGRSSGYSAQGLPFPVMTGTVPDATGNKLWLHESGLDEIDGTAVNPVRSYFETPLLGGLKANPPNDKGLSYQQIEGDFVQSGDMTAQIIGQANSKAPVVYGPVVPMKYIPQVPQEQLSSFKEGHRQARIHFESNTLGGYYEMGKTFVHVEPNESRITG